MTTTSWTKRWRRRFRPATHLANTVETGIRIAPDAPPPGSPVVLDRPEASRFEAVVDGQAAFLQYERRPHSFVLAHTEVPNALRGQGVGNALARFALASARAEGVTIVVRCPFVRAYLQKHRDVARP